MSQVVPAKQRAFALEVLKRLRGEGFEAFWAGGCVRDQLLGRQPKDYDVATNATPDQIRRLFGRRRTLEIGAAFGVVAVVGPKPAGTVEVTTFRRDERYSDGRHPDSIVFSTPQADAQRRDFTINGLFYDPLKEPAQERVIDYVGGLADLELGLVRAIGDPRARFAEDKLRMLRAVRFAASFGFALEAGTRAAIQEMAADVTEVSAERIALEMRFILLHPSRRDALELLGETCLLAALLPEVAPLGGLAADEPLPPGGDLWDHTLSALARLTGPSFPLALAALLHEVGAAALQSSSAGAPAADRSVAATGVAEDVCRRWRLSNKETERVCWLVRHHMDLFQARSTPWPKLQRLLIADGIDELVALAEADALAGTGDTATIDDCRRLLNLPKDELNPPPLITGDDLIAHGVPQGTSYKLLLEKVRDAQLEKEIFTKSDALALVDRLLVEGLEPGR